MGHLSISNLPVGFVFPIINSNVVPTGSLECNGALISKTTYANLYSGGQLSINGLYGESGGSFYLPDLRGRALRGWDHGAGRDTGAGSRNTDEIGGVTGDNVGSHQHDKFAEHNHGPSQGLRSVGELIGGSSPRQMAEFSGLGSPAPNTGLSGNGPETIMKNTNVMWCIKY